MTTVLPRSESQDLVRGGEVRERGREERGGRGHRHESPLLTAEILDEWTARLRGLGLSDDHMAVDRSGEDAVGE